VDKKLTKASPFCSTNDISMVGDDNYKYSVTLSFMEPFVNLFIDEPFIDNMPDLYGTLLQFKENVAAWAFELNRFQDFIHLRYQVQQNNEFFAWH